jgi:hypothetical protein
MADARDNQSRIGEAFAGILRSGQSEFNSQFAEARRLYPDLDGATFSEFLRTTVDGLVRAVEKERPDRVAEVAMAAYEVGLELVSQKQVGPGARHHWIEEGWQRVLPAVVPVLAMAPLRIIGAVSNALHHLATTPGARPAQWLADIERMGRQCEDSDTLLRLGQVTAWKAGLAHFRQGGILAADALAPSLALAAVGAPNSGTWPEIRRCLLADPWFDPGTPIAEDNRQTHQLQVMTRAGAFRGFGGFFVGPPRVAAAGEHFLVRSAEECWLLTADLFGATFHRTSPGDFESALEQTKLPHTLRIADSKLLWNKKLCELPPLGKVTSVAANETTVALTSDLTHSVLLAAIK